MKVIVAIVFSLFSVICFSQEKIFVATYGNDKNPGTIQLPLKSIHVAIAKVASLKSKSVEIFLRKGKYYISKTIDITPSILSNHKLEISAFNSESVILSGAKKISPQWKNHKGKILQSFVGKNLSIDQLFCNGKAMVLARYPNYDSSAHFLNGTAADAVSDSRIKSWSNPSGGFIHALHNGEWGGFHYQITGKTKSDSLLLVGGWQNNRPSPMHKSHRFVENIFEELDTGGEWFYNPSSGVLYIYPVNGSNLKSSIFEFSVLNEIIHISGNEQTPAENITIKDIGFTEANRTFMLTREPLLRSDWTIYRGGAILIEGAKNITIEGCRFSDLGGNALFVSKFNRDIIISNNHIHHIGGNAIAFVGDSSAVRSPSFRYENFIPLADIDKTPGPKNNNYPSNCLASNNLIHDIGRTEKQVAGVEISMSMNIDVIHNTIYNVPRAGINIGDGCWGGHSISYNDVFNTVLETGDHGAFNSWGRDRYWHPNYNIMQQIATNDSLLIFADVIRPITINNNRFHCDHGWDIDLDDGSSNYIIYNNVCLQGGLKLREGFKRTVKNNIIINNSFHPHVWFKNSHDIFMHNIILDSYKPIRLDGWGDTVDYNFFPDMSSLQKARKNGTDLNSIFGDPEFIDNLTGDYRVKQNSLALKVGFKNFPMNEFGVITPTLKKLAKQPPFSSQLFGQLSNDAEVIASWMGAKIKKLSGIGERSATGMAEEKGVYVVDVIPGTTAYKFGLQKNDVIINVDGATVNNIKEVMTTYSGSRWKGSVELIIFRNQQEIKIITKDN